MVKGTRLSVEFLLELFAGVKLRQVSYRDSATDKQRCGSGKEERWSTDGSACRMASPPIF